MNGVKCPQDFYYFMVRQRSNYIFILDLFINFVCFFQGILAVGLIFLPLPISYLIGKDSSMILRLLLKDHERQIRKTFLYRVRYLFSKNSA